MSLHWLRTWKRENIDEMFNTIIYVNNNNKKGGKLLGTIHMVFELCLEEEVEIQLLDTSDFHQPTESSLPCHHRPRCLEWFPYLPLTIAPVMKSELQKQILHEHEVG